MIPSCDYILLYAIVNYFHLSKVFIIMSSEGNTFKPSENLVSLNSNVEPKIDAPLSSLMDSTTNPRVKTTKGEGIGARSLAHNISRVEGCARAPGWD